MSKLTSYNYLTIILLGIILLSASSQSYSINNQLHVVFIHYILDDDKNSLPHPALFNQINQLFEVGGGVNVRFKNNCDNVNNSTVRFKRMGTDLIDASA